eukprot:8589002-Pyramimonas_sp.AAC.1
MIARATSSTRGRLPRGRFSSMSADCNVVAAGVSSGASPGARSRRSKPLLLCKCPCIWPVLSMAVFDLPMYPRVVLVRNRRKSFSRMATSPQHLICG